MGAKSFNPPLTPADAKECARRYAEGSPLAALTAAYRVWTLTVKYAVKRHGVALRPEDCTPRMCRLCGKPAAGNTKRRLCAVHVRRFCSRCEDELPEARVDRWCGPCQQANKERRYARKIRPCTTCAEGIVTGHACRCADCLRSEYEADRRLLLTLVRKCAGCGEQMPKGRRQTRCMVCYRRHLRRLRKARLERGEHVCVMCGEELPLSRQSYCKGCDTMLANWRRAYNSGCEIAALFGTVETRRRWQEKEAA